jgi:hypothetical protein
MIAAFARYRSLGLRWLQKASAYFLIYVATGALLGYALQLGHSNFMPTCLFDAVPEVPYSYCPSSDYKLFQFLTLGLPSSIVTIFWFVLIEVIFDPVDRITSVLVLIECSLVYACVFGPGIWFLKRSRPIVCLIVCLIIAVEMLALGPGE